MMAKFLIFFVAACLFGRFDVEGKYIEGHLQTAEDWHFLARFCFLSEKGRLEFEFEYPRQDYEPQNILLYYDEPDQWPAVYKSDKNCTQRKNALNPANNQIIKLTDRYYWSGCRSETISGVEIFRCSAGRTFRSGRERWWFFALEHCNAPKGLNLKYKITMTNGEDLLHKHFSADEFYILPIDIAFLIAIFLVFLGSVYVAVSLRNRQLFHTTYKMYMTSLVLEFFHLFIMCIAYGKYANDGLENYGLISFGRAFEAGSILVFLLMLILLGKGYTITRGRLSTGGSIKIAIFMTLYAITYAVLFIYEANFFDPGEVLYLYESPPGYGLIALRMIGWIWFCYAIFFTLKHYPEKSSFYFPFFVFYTLWFWASTVVIFVASSAIDQWVREKTVVGVMNTVTFLGQVFFLILTRPSAANSNFPYHVRTTQIGVMGSAPTQGGAPVTAGKETESFTPHPYAPSSNLSLEMSTTNGGPNFTELFTVSNTRSTPQNGSIDKFPHEPTKPVGNPFIVTS